MARLKGKDLMLAVDSTSAGIVGASTGCTVDVSCSMSEITSALSGRAKSFIPGRYSWTLTATGIMATGTSTYPKTFLQRLLSGQSLTAYFGLDSTNLRLSGTVHVLNWRLGAPAEGNATYDVTFQGSGALSIL